jgi:hypothetical protein
MLATCLCSCCCFWGLLAALCRQRKQKEKGMNVEVKMYYNTQAMRRSQGQIL